MFRTFGIKFWVENFHKVLWSQSPVLYYLRDFQTLTDFEDTISLAF